MDPKAPSPSGPLSADLLRQKLDTMIDERLIAQEAARMPAADITAEELDKARSGLIQTFGSEDLFRRRVESVGLTPARIDRLLRQRILITKFVDEKTSETSVENAWAGRQPWSNCSLWG